MDSALAWIGQLAEWLGKFFPRFALLTQGEGAVKYEGFFLPARLRRYKEPIRLTVHEPGLHWYWPATSSWQEYPTALQTDNLPSQTMETVDGISIVAGGMISYRVSDLGKLLPHCHSAVKLVQSLVLTSIHETCCSYKWPDLKEAQRRRTLNTKLRNAAKRTLAEFGIEVVDCMLTDLVRTRVYRLIQSTQQDDM